MLFVELAGNRDIGAGVGKDRQDDDQGDQVEDLVGQANTGFKDNEAVYDRSETFGPEPHGKISFARRYVTEVPFSDLVEVAGKHIPMEDSRREIAAAMLEHLLARSDA